jgi:hypothetical protein
MARTLTSPSGKAQPSRCDETSSLSQALTLGTIARVVDETLSLEISYCGFARGSHAVRLREQQLP